jgi:hypothetical protein
MKYLEAPAPLTPELAGMPKLFLAGGITNCPPWQEAMAAMLDITEYLVMNPRRANFPIDDPDAAEMQITWEHEHLRHADAILFWFPQETLCPIALYELGAWSMTNKMIHVGLHPEYQRRQDVEIQTKLVRPAIHIVYSLRDLAQQVIRMSPYQHVEDKLAGTIDLPVEPLLEPSGINEMSREAAEALTNKKP